MISRVKSWVLSKISPKPAMTSKELVKELRDFLARARRGEEGPEKVAYVANLLQCGIIEAYWNGKVSEKVMLRHVFGVDGSDVGWEKDVLGRGQV